MRKLTAENIEVQESKEVKPIINTEGIKVDKTGHIAGAARDMYEELCAKYDLQVPTEQMIQAEATERLLEGIRGVGKTKKSPVEI